MALNTLIERFKSLYPKDPKSQQRAESSAFVLWHETVERGNEFPRGLSVVAAIALGWL